MNNLNLKSLFDIDDGNENFKIYETHSKLWVVKRELLNERKKFKIEK